MGRLFKDLCRGPVVVIDDRIGEKDDLINKLISEIRGKNLPILSYKSLKDVRKVMAGLFFSNFIILDWKMAGKGADLPLEAQIGGEGEYLHEMEVIDFIRELRGICLAPIFVLTAFNTEEVEKRLREEGLISEGENYVFVENKNRLCEKKGALFSKIEDWIKDNTHIYLCKWWTNELLGKNTLVFWDLFDLSSNWPTSFYRTFKEDGVDPVLALRDTLSQLLFSEIDVSQVKQSFLDVEVEEGSLPDQRSLKDLYTRLVYTRSKDIERDIRPGDVYKKNGSYYLNIRPECDTTTRVERNPKLYLLKGDIRDLSRISYDAEGGIIVEKRNEIVMPFLDGDEIVVFNSRKLYIETLSRLRNDYEKICRVLPPFITNARQRYSSYLGRFGIPRYQPMRSSS